MEKYKSEFFDIEYVIKFSQKLIRNLKKRTGGKKEDQNQNRGT